MKRKHPYIYSLIVLLVFAVSSCKEDNSIYPQVTIESPFPVGIYGFNDTLNLKVKVESSDGRVSINLMSENKVLPISNLLVNQEGSVRYYDLYFTDPYLESGNYDLRVQAFNGSNRFSDFFEITYKASPARMKGFVVLSRDQNDLSTITRYDSLWAAESTQLQGDYSYLAYNSREQLLVCAPVTEGKLQGLGFDRLSSQFDFQNPSIQGLRQYEDVFHNEDFVFVLEHEGRILGLTAGGAISRSFQGPVGYIPQRGIVDDPGFLLAGQEDGKEAFMLFLLNPQNGAVLKQKAVPGKIQAMSYVGDNQFVVCYQKANAALIALYNVQFNTLTTYGSLNGELVQDLLCVSNSQCLLATTTGIFRFNPSLVQIPVLLYSFAASDMVYDKLSQDVYFASNRDVLVSRQGQVPTSVFSVSDPIYKIAIAYTK